MDKKRTFLKKKQNEIIGQNLKHIRRGAGLSQPELAELLNITFQQVQKYEKGTNRLPITHLHFLKSFLDLPYESFFNGLERDTGLPTGKPEFRLAHKLALIANPVLMRKIERITEILALEDDKFL